MLCNSSTTTTGSNQTHVVKKESFKLVHYNGYGDFWLSN